MSSGEPIALVHDYLTQRGGAERVALLLARAFPESTLFTSLYAPERTFPEFAEVDIRTSALNRLHWLRRDHRLAFPVLAPVFSAQNIEADVVLCNSSGWAHGIRTSGRKVVYCHAPARWLYQTDRYLGRSGANSVGGGSGRADARRRMAGLAVGALSPYLRRWDRRSAESADRYLTNSRAMATFIREVYDIDAEIIPPPPGLLPEGAQQPLEGVVPGYFLCVTRLLPYKNVDVLVDAMRELPGHRLIVVGDGAVRIGLEPRATPNVKFVGQVDDPSLRWLYDNALASVAASYEDYGLTPLEAAGFGTPSVVLRAGGFLDTVVEDSTGVFFDRPIPSLAAEAMTVAADASWDRSYIIEHAKKYSTTAFMQRVRGVVENASLGPRGRTDTPTAV